MTTHRFRATNLPELDALYADLATADLQPLWLQKGLLPATPPLRMRPWIWHSKVLTELATRAQGLVGIDRGGDRRVLALSHPDLNGMPFATHTLWGAVQILGPGETAPPHRHTPGALRFVMQGSGAWTAVDSDPITMNPGDLLLTPPMCWHEHHNDGDGMMLWFDGLDLPLVHSLDAVFFEPGSDTIGEYVVAGPCRSEKRYLAPGILPEIPTAPAAHSDLPVYRWRETDRALTAVLNDHGGNVGTVRFADPVTGRDIMPTLRARMMRLLPGSRTPSTRTVGSSIWVVFRGEGTSVINGVAFSWSEGDIFVVPSWAALDHEVNEAADLFVMSDEPVIEALALNRIEVLAAHQQITTDAATFLAGSGATATGQHA
jgi:gentisate 1,2-dioxygenase